MPNASPCTGVPHKPTSQAGGHAGTQAKSPHTGALVWERGVRKTCGMAFAKQEEVGIPNGETRACSRWVAKDTMHV